VRLTTNKNLKANAYVLSQYSKISQYSRIVGVYPTMKRAEQASAKQDELMGDVINTIYETTLYDVIDLELYAR
jgi:hypothetical protein